MKKQENIRLYFTHTAKNASNSVDNDTIYNFTLICNFVFNFLIFGFDVCKWFGFSPNFFFFIYTFKKKKKIVQPPALHSLCLIQGPSVLLF